MSLTIPARDLQRGDQFDFCGLPATVHFATDTPGNAPTSTGIHFDIESGSGTVWVTPDTLVTVDRTDPDEELIERIAEAICTLDAGAYQDASEELRDRYRLDARAALAVVRAEQ